MREMKFEAPKEEIDALFTEWDPDNSGALELKELGRLLRRGSEIQLDPKLQAGAMGKIETKAKSRRWSARYCRYSLSALAAALLLPEARSSTPLWSICSAAKRWR